MSGMVQILRSLFLAVLLWGGSAAVASAHPGHHEPTQARASAAAEAAAVEAAAVEAFATADHTPVGGRHAPMTADHCVQFQCHAAPALNAARDDSGPLLTPERPALPFSAAVPHGIVTDPPRRPPRILS